MAIITGGVLGEFGAARGALGEVQQVIRTFAPRTSEDDYAVDIAFLTTGTSFTPADEPGVSAGPVGRTQRRFIVWHTLPTGLDTPVAVRTWLVEHLPETERLVRDYLPTKSKRYPAQALADEIAGLRAALTRSDT